MNVLENLATRVDIETAFGIDVKTKDEAIKAVIHQLAQAGCLLDEERFTNDVFDREKELPTYIGYGFGLPHSQSNYVKQATIGIGRLKEPIIWTDDKKVDFIFLIAVPYGGGENVHLKILAKLARLLMHDDFRDKLRSSSEAEVKALLLETQSN